MEVAPFHRKILYEVALLSGLRAGELRSLTPSCVDAEHGALVLDASWTKNRKPGLQPIPRELATRLVEYGESRAAEELYRNHYGRQDARAADIPDDPLLFVSTHPSRELGKDLKSAGVPRHIPGEGKVDFHSLRVAFITYVYEAGAHAKEAQELARHSTPSLTLNIYAKARKENLSALVDKVASSFPKQSKFVKCLSNEDKEGDGDDSISPIVNNLDGVNEWWRRRDSKLLDTKIIQSTEPTQFHSRNHTILLSSMQSGRSANRLRFHKQYSFTTEP